jgi:hypothetical protein
VYNISTEEATEDSSKHLKHIFSYDILANPYYSTKFNYYPAATPHRLLLVCCPNMTKVVDEQASSTSK